MAKKRITTKSKKETSKYQRPNLIPTIEQHAKKKGSMAKKGMGYASGSPFSIAGNSNLTKSGGFTKNASYDVTQTPPQFYAPELTPETWLLPKSRLEILKWVRVFFNLDPYIQSILMMHAQYPICDFKLQYKDKDISDFFNQQLFNNPEFSWIDFLEQLMLSYWKFGEACLTGDTKIRLLDGTSKTIKELYENNASNFDVYSLDAEGNIVPGKANKVVLTKKNAEIIKITLDNGEFFKCTPDHKILKRDGVYVEAQDLGIGEALMPLYTKDSSVYYKNENWKKRKSRNTPKEYLNHKVLSIESCPNEDVYDIQSVDKYHNFALACGVFVHNCVWGDWNPVKGTWNAFSLVDPSLIKYQENPTTGKVVMELEPTDELKKMVAQQLTEGRSELSPAFIQCVMENEDIPLDAEGTEPNYLEGRKYSPPKAFMFVRKTDPGATRGSPPIQCVRGSTKIKLLDGTTPTIEELYNNKTENFWVYACNEKGEVVAKKATKAIYNGRQLTYNVTLDNGEVVGITSDHPWLMRDGTWKLTKELKKGDALMPLYTKEEHLGENKKTKSSYEKLYHPGTGTWQLTHVMSALQENKKQFKLTGSRVIHHKDFNSCNNVPENLEVISREKHAKIHSVDHTERLEKARKTAYLPEVRAKAAKKMVALWSTPEYKKKLSKKHVQTHANKTEREKNAWKRSIGDSNREKYDSTRQEIAKKIQSVINQNPTANYEVIAKQANISSGTISNYINKYKLVTFPEYKNHTVVDVTVHLEENVYDIESVEELHNFAVAFSDDSGVFIHNCLFKDLIYKDKIRLAQIAIADRFHLPVEIWTIGQYTGDPKTSIIPSDEDLAEFRNLIQQATMQPPFSIYLPPYVKYEAIGVNGKLLSVYEDLGYVENSIFVGLGVNKNLITGSGPSFSSSKQVSLFRLIKMYKVLRAKLDAFIKRYIILPIARANDLKDENGQWIIPEIIWSESLQPEQDKEIFDSFSKLHDKGLVSTKSLLEKFMVTVDYDLEQQRLKEEVGTIWDNRKRIAGGKMSGGAEVTDKAPGASSKPGTGPEGSETDDKSYLKPPMEGSPDSLAPEQKDNMEVDMPDTPDTPDTPTPLVE